MNKYMADHLTELARDLAAELEDLAKEFQHYQEAARYAFLVSQKNHNIFGMAKSSAMIKALPLRYKEAKKSIEDCYTDARSTFLDLVKRSSIGDANVLED